MTPRIDISDSLAYRIYRVQRLLRRNLSRITSSAGVDLTPEQWFVLNKLRLQGGQAQVELGEGIFADRPNMTRIVAGLEKRNLVHRQGDPGDGRRSLVYLTDEGRSVHDRVAVLALPARSRIFDGIAEGEVKKTSEVLQIIEDNILNQKD